VLELEELEVAAHAAAARHRGREADLVEAVVDSHPHVVDVDRARGHLGQERERHEAVRDRRAERAGLCPLGVNVDPLVIAGRVGEEVDALLRDLDPVADRRVAADVTFDLGEGRVALHQFTQVMIGSHCSRSPWNRVEATSQSVSPCAARWT
jgi:hypothetical protein